MVKQTQTIHRQQPTNCLSELDHFVRLALKGLMCALAKKKAPRQYVDLVVQVFEKNHFQSGRDPIPIKIVQEGRVRPKLNGCG